MLNPWRFPVLVAVLIHLGIIGDWGIRTQGAPLPDKEQAVRVPKELAKQIKSLLPKGWKVVTRADTLVVRRDQPVRFYNPINLPPFSSKEAFQTYVRKNSVQFMYELSLRFRPRMRHKEYKRLEAVNARTSKRLEALRDNLRHIPHKFDDYLPSSPEEKRLVQEYRRAEKKLPHHRLPDMYSARHSIDLTRQPVTGWVFVDKKTSQECSKVQGQVIGLFKRYKQEN